MNFLKRYSCASHRDKEAFLDDDISAISDLGFDGEDGSSVYKKAPSSKELAVELFQLMRADKRSTAENLDTLERIQVWTFVACDEEHAASSREFVKQETVPTLLHFVRKLLENPSSGDSDTCMDKACQIIYHCTSYQDRGTSKLEKSSKDMNIQLVKHNGVETMVKAMERYHLKASFVAKSIFNTLWTILMNVATCDKTVALLKYPRAMFERQEELLLNAMARYMSKAEGAVPVFWIENMLIGIHRLLKFDGKANRHTRQVMAQARILNRLLDVLMEGKKKLASRDPCVTALAMSLLQTCLLGVVDDVDDDSVVEGARQHDELRRSIDFDRLTRFAVKGIDSFPGSDIIQGQGHVILEEVPPVYRLLACHNDLTIVPSPCGPDADNLTVSNVVGSLAGPFWHCRPTKLH